MLRHALVVAAEDLERRHHAWPQARSSPPRRSLLADRRRRRSRRAPILARRPRALAVGPAPSSRQATPSARNPAALSPSKTFAARTRAASSSDRSSGLPGSSYRVARLDDIFGSALEHRRRRPSCFRRGPKRGVAENRRAPRRSWSSRHRAKGAGCEDCGIERVPQSGLEMAVEPGQIEQARSLSGTRGERYLSLEADLGFGERPGFVGTQHVHAAQVMDRAKTRFTITCTFAPHADGTAGERH